MSGPATTPLSGPVEDYLKAVYALETRLEGPVPTNALAERLGLTPGSVSGMLRRLDELGPALSHKRRQRCALIFGQVLALEIAFHNAPYNG